MSRLAERLKELRIEKGITKKKISEDTGINERNYRQYEAGDVEPSTSKLEKLADYFEVSTDYLLGRTNIPDALNNETIKEFESIYDDFKSLGENFASMEQASREIATQFKNLNKITLRTAENSLNSELERE